MWVDEFAVIHRAEIFLHSDVRQFAKTARRSGTFAHTVVLDMSQVRETSTEAFADLIVLRRRMLREGRDLKLAGLRDRPARLYEINRLTKILPLR